MIQPLVPITVNKYTWTKDMDGEVVNVQSILMYATKYL